VGGACQKAPHLAEANSPHPPRSVERVRPPPGKAGEGAACVRGKTRMARQKPIGSRAKSFVVCATQMDDPAIHPPRPSDCPRSPPRGGPARFTPMMEQYLEIKAANPGLLLFYTGWATILRAVLRGRRKSPSRALGNHADQARQAIRAWISRCAACPVVETLPTTICIALNRAGSHRVCGSACEQMEDPAAARARGKQEAWCAATWCGW